MSWDKTVKDDGVEFAPVFLKGFLGADCPGKDRRSVQTFSQKEADILAGDLKALNDSIKSGLPMKFKSRCCTRKHST